MIFLISHQNQCCDPSSELSHQDGSDDCHNIYFYAELKKNIPNHFLSTALIIHHVSMV